MTAGNDRRSQFLGEVVRAHDQHGDSRVSRQLAHVEDRRRRLDHRPDLDVRRGTGGIEAVRHLVDRRERVDLGDDDRRRIRGTRRSDVGGAPLGVEPIASDREFPVAVLTRLHCGHGLVTCVRFRIRRDGIFEIEDDRVGRNRLRLLQRTIVGGRHVQHGTAGSQVVGHRDSPIVRGQDVRRCLAPTNMVLRNRRWRRVRGRVRRDAWRVRPRRGTASPMRRLPSFRRASAHRCHHPSPRSLAARARRRRGRG